MHKYKLGHKYSTKKAEKVTGYVSKFLSNGEYIKGIFPANRVIPAVDTIMITNMRLICINTSYLDSPKAASIEVAGDSVVKASAEKTKWTGSLVPLKIYAEEGKEVKAASVRAEDIETVVSLVLEMKGRPVSIQASAKEYMDKQIRLREVENEKVLARKAEVIRAFEKTESERSDRDRELLETPEGKEMIKKANEALVARHEAMQAGHDKAVASEGFCPKCGSDRLQAVQEVNTKGVSTTASAAGCCFLGPLGLLCGLPGAGRSTTKTLRMCLNCGKKF